MAVDYSEKDRMGVERANLLSICKLVVKELIDLSLSSAGRSLEDDHDPLAQFLIVLEHILLHGAKGLMATVIYWNYLNCTTEFHPKG